MTWRVSNPPGQLHLFPPSRAQTCGLPPVLEHFAGGLSRRPYVYDGELAYIRGRDRAMDFPNIQHGLPASSQWLAIDVDREFEHVDFGIEPAPHIVCRNRSNGHAHLLWRLLYPARRDRPWYRSLRQQLDQRFAGDTWFAGTMVKNPLRADLHEVFTRAAPPWTFRGLAGRLDPVPPAAAAAQLQLWQKITDAPGRNCHVFEAVRVRAYLQARHCASLDEFRAWCLEQCRRVLVTPALGARELVHIARSISAWTWRHQQKRDRAFSAIQTHRGQLSGAKRLVGSIKEREPWKQEGISRATWFRRRETRTINQESDPAGAADWITIQEQQGGPGGEPPRR